MIAASPSANPDHGIELTRLRAGDVVEVHRPDGPRIYRGEVETIEVSQGVLWILHGALRERKLLLACEYHIYRCPPEHPTVSAPL